jgi:hypothetical protein
MNLKQVLKRSGTLFLSICMLGLSTVPAQASMIGTQQMIQSENSRIERAQLNELLNRDDVQAQLIKMGVDPVAAKERVASLTDSEIAQLNAHLEQLPAGKGVLGVLVFLFLVFVVTDMLGATGIFPFVHPINK